MDRFAVILGSLLMFIGVGAGAFGAHGLESYFNQNPNLKSTFDTALQYQIMHSLALFAAAWVISKWNSKAANWAVVLFLVGITLFSGSLFLLVFTHVTWLGVITPLGGLAFLSGWLCLAYAAWKN